MKLLQIGRDSQSLPDYTKKISDVCSQINMTAVTKYTLPVPVGANKVFFSATDHFFIAGTDFNLPQNGVWTDDNIEMSPTGILLDGETTLHFIARTQIDLNVSFYR